MELVEDERGGVLGVEACFLVYSTMAGHCKVSHEDVFQCRNYLHSKEFVVLQLHFGIVYLNGK